MIPISDLITSAGVYILAFVAGVIVGAIGATYVREQTAPLWWCERHRDGDD